MLVSLKWIRCSKYPASISVARVFLSLSQIKSHMRLWRTKTYLGLLKWWKSVKALEEAAQLAPATAERQWQCWVPQPSFWTMLPDRNLNTGFKSRLGKFLLCGWVDEWPLQVTGFKIWTHYSTFSFKITTHGRVEKGISARMFSVVKPCMLGLCWGGQVLDIAAVSDASTRLVRNVTEKKNS